MLKGRLIHPELSQALAAAGHGGRVLLADANYPVSTATPHTATRISLNLAPGMLSVTDVLDVLLDAIPIEGAAVMVPDSGPDPAVFTEFRRLLDRATTGPGGATASFSIERLGRHQFYAAASAPNVAVAVATGEGRLYANLLLTIGVVA